MKTRINDNKMNICKLFYLFILFTLNLILNKRVRVILSNYERQKLKLRKNKMDRGKLVFFFWSTGKTCLVFTFNKASRFFSPSLVSFSWSFVNMRQDEAMGEQNKFVSYAERDERRHHIFFAYPYFYTVWHTIGVVFSDQEQHQTGAIWFRVLCHWFGSHFFHLTSVSSLSHHLPFVGRKKFRTTP